MPNDQFLKVSARIDPLLVAMACLHSHMHRMHALVLLRPS